MQHPDDTPKAAEVQKSWDRIYLDKEPHAGACNGKADFSSTLFIYQLGLMLSTRFPTVYNVGDMQAC